jgi:hypothetical protein
VGVHENISEFFDSALERTVTVRGAHGKPLIHLGLIHLAGVAAAGVIMAPRLTAVAAFGALLKGYSVSIDPPMLPDA